MIDPYSIVGLVVLVFFLLIIITLACCHLPVKVEGYQGCSKVARPADRQWQGQVGVKCDRRVSAGGASDCALQLPIHEIDNDALISGEECLPEELTHLLIWSLAIVIRHLDIWLLLHPVEVFVDQIEQIIEQFTSVLLAIAAEPGHSLAQYTFEVVRRGSSVFVDPHFLEEACKSSREPSFQAKRILFVDVLLVCVE